MKDAMLYHASQVWLPMTTQSWGSAVVLLTLLGLATVLVSSNIVLKGLGRRPRRLPGVYVAGTEGGKLSLQDARRKFIHHCGDMMREGYNQVSYPSLCELPQHSSLLLFLRQTGVSSISQLRQGIGL